MAYTVWSAGELIGGVTPFDADGTVIEREHPEGVIAWFFAAPAFERVKPVLETIRARMSSLPKPDPKLDMKKSEDVVEWNRRWSERSVSIDAKGMMREYGALRLELRDENGAVVRSEFISVLPFPADAKGLVPEVSEADRIALSAQGVNLSGAFVFSAFLGFREEELKS